MFNFFFRKNYIKKLAKTKSLFSKAYDKAAMLVAKMQQDIDDKKAYCKPQQRDCGAYLCAE